jgi:diphthamide synthase subunit DPH2
MSKTIVLCASVAFYEHVNQLADELKALGFNAVVPETASKMRKSGNYDVDSVKTWLNNPEYLHEKARLMRGHFDKVAGGDIVLVVNDEKHGIRGYIGPNVLMEMGLAFHLKKPIYVLQTTGKEMTNHEEVAGMGSVFIDGDLTKIK